MSRYGLVIDLKRCIGCHACSVACKAENGTPPGVWWSKVLTQEEGTYPSATITYLPLLCPV
jgi:Fe-S-cluster-containing dehydrogenase component